MNIKQSLKQAIAKLVNANIKSANLDARLLLAQVLNQPTEYLFLNSSYNLTDFEVKNFAQLIAERSSLVPIAYILGHREFYGRRFEINNHVLIPRPDTETLITAITSSSYVLNSDLRILELGVGSGCIIITLLLEMINASGIGCDIDQQALEISAINTKMYNLDQRLKLVKTDWFQDVAQEKFDIIVSNPPYIATNQKNLMSRETLLYEPAIALFAKNQGLENYVNIASEAQNFLTDEGSVFLEVGFNQTDQVHTIFGQAGFLIASIFKDLSGVDRVLQFTKCD